MYEGFVFSKLPITHARDVEIVVDEMLCPYCEYDVLGDELYYLYVNVLDRKETST